MKTSSSLKVVLAYGTRPECIKLAPVVRALEGWGMQVVTVHTGQHREMATAAARFFDLRIHHQLEVMTSGQSLAEITVRALSGMDGVLAAERPDWVVVQGDTTTAMTVALAAFYRGIAVAHVEAGLRTHNRASPFPEEMNRQLIARLAALHFAPTAMASENLLAEGIPAGAIEITGNTVVDALQLAQRRLEDPAVSAAVLAALPVLDPERRLILVTAHRRESFGEPFRHLCLGLRHFAETSPVEIVFPVHLNPKVREPVNAILAGLGNVHLLEPVDYPVLVSLAARSHFIVTDSGGIQEEAATLGKPVLVARDTTERGEGVAAGVARLVGTSEERLLDACRELLGNDAAYRAMSGRRDLYGDGRASERIAERLAQKCG